MVLRFWRAHLVLLCLFAAPSRPQERDAALAALNSHLQNAQAALEREQYAAAIAELKAAIELQPNLRGAYYQLGFSHFQRNEFDPAERAFRRELGFPPLDPYSLYYLGRIRLAEGKRTEAVREFERSLEAGEVADVRQRLASGYLALGRIAQAVQFLEVSTRVRMEDGSLHYLLGRAYSLQGKKAEASREFAAAERWKRKFREEMVAVADLRSALSGTNAEAIAKAAEALAKSSDADILHAAGSAMGSAGRAPDAVRFLSRALEIQPDLAAAWSDLGTAHLSLGEEVKAEEALRAAVQRRPDFYEPRALLGTLYANSGRGEDAIQQLRAAAQNPAASARVLTLLGLQYFELRYFSDAITVLRRASQQDPANPDPRYLLIQAHYRNLEYETALRLAQETAQKFPKDPLAHYHAGAQLTNMGRLNEAAAELQIALQGNPRLAEARAMYADVLFKQGKAEASIAEFRGALEADSKLADAYAGLGKALVQLKRFPEAASAMEEAIRVDSTVAAFHLHYSQALRALGRLEEAKAEAQLFTRWNEERARARDANVERKYEDPK